MDDSTDNRLEPGRRQHLLRSLDKMVTSGRVTPAEADRLRASDEPDLFDNAIRDIRVRHAGSALADAVEEGSLTQDEADGLLERLNSGEHPKGVRAHLRKARRRRPAGGTRAVPPAGGEAEQTCPSGSGLSAQGRAIDGAVSPGSRVGGPHG